MVKTAVVVLSDPSTKSEESLGRVFNALSTAYEAKSLGSEVTLLFQGAGTRWVGELSRKDHPGHELFEKVRDVVRGASCGCADVFGATESVEKAGVDLVRDFALPGTRGVPSLQALIRDGYSIVTF
jgi:hypothetical protein